MNSRGSNDPRSVTKGHATPEGLSHARTALGNPSGVAPEFLPFRAIEVSSFEAE